MQYRPFVCEFPASYSDCRRQPGFNMITGRSDSDADCRAPAGTDGVACWKMCGAEADRFPVAAQEMDDGISNLSAGAAAVCSAIGLFVCVLSVFRWRSHHVKTCINMDVFAGDSACQVAQQEHARLAHFFRIDVPSQR